MKEKKIDDTFPLKNLNQSQSVIIERTMTLTNQKKKQHN